MPNHAEITHEQLPQAGTIWRHRGGARYRVMGVANWFGDREPTGKFPLTVVYANAAGQIWSRPLARWWGSFEPVTDEAVSEMTVHAPPAPPADDLPNLMTTVAMCIGMFAELAHRESVTRGWYTDPHTGERIQRNIGEMLALAHSELSEALEGDRKMLADDHLPDLPSVLVEIGDAFIRLGDLSSYICSLPRYQERFGDAAMDIGRAVAEKMAYNRRRADHSLEARKAGGKAY